MRRSRALRNAGYAVWWTALAVAVVLVTIRHRDRAAALERATRVSVDAPIDAAVVGSADTVRLFSPGESFAALVVSPTCAFCVDRADALARRLGKIPADRRAVVALAYPDSVARIFRRVVPDVPTVVPADPFAMRRIGIGWVPTLVVTARDGSVVAAHVGVPPRRLLRRLRTELLGGG